MLWVAQVGIELPAGRVLEVGRSMIDAKLGAFGGTAPYTWAVAGRAKLPAGLTLDPAQGTIRGTPDAPGSFALVIVVKDANGAVGIAPITLEVKKSGG